MSARFKQTTLNATITRTTDKAVLVVIDDEEHWIPRSVCLDGDALETGDEDLIVADWWLEKEGLL
ncbi:MAG: hypothetical protein E6R08_09810 [Nevskiaceae bacterium]|nr:MAG: hypothetical protein E6R08_09810 [Nevskiaceae bacterium]